jgi:hypothetical protein
MASAPRKDGWNRDPRIVDALRQVAHPMQILLICGCGRDEVDADGICRACEADLPYREDMARWEHEHAEAVRRHALAVKVECPYCGASEGAECVTERTRSACGIRDHKDRYRAACSLLVSVDDGDHR